MDNCNVTVSLTKPLGSVYSQDESLTLLRKEQVLKEPPMVEERDLLLHTHPLRFSSSYGHHVTWWHQWQLNWCMCCWVPVDALHSSSQKVF